MPEYLSPGVYIEETPSAGRDVVGVGTSTAAFVGKAPDQIELPSGIRGEPFTLPGKAGVAKLCTNFSEFRAFFGDFSLDPGHNTLAHAVFGFFDNGGTRCYVVRIIDESGLEAALTALGAIDEIAIVAAPGMTDGAVRRAIDAHCRVKTQNRFAIFDCPESIVDDRGLLDLPQLNPSNPKNILPANSDHAAFYFPWIEVFDPAKKTLFPDSDGRIFVPPSGHVAGVYARVDAHRGVFKAPANEVVVGALGLKYTISKAQQDGLNPQGVNCLRDFNGSIRVWGARTIGGDANGEFRYINVRRTLIFLSQSIDEGLQWVVFEPNDEPLWAEVHRSIGNFLVREWMSGALMGRTPDEAFFVRCDRTTMTQDDIDNGRLICLIGVAPTKPAEFIIFRFSHKTADAPP